MSNIGEVTLLISTIATSIGTVFGIGLSIYTIKKRESRYFKVDAREHQQLVNPLPGYFADRKYTNLRVINLGNRPIRIASAGYAYLNYSGGGIFSDSLTRSSSIIEVDGVADYLGDETERASYRISYYYATSLTGKTRKRYMIFRGFVWGRDLLDKLRLYMKKEPHLAKLKSKNKK